MSKLDAANYFTDLSLVDDPFPYFEEVRSKGPVWREPHHGVVVVTDYDIALAVYRDDERFSNANSPTGPIPGLPFTPTGDDIGPMIEEYRDRMVHGDWLATRDRPAHTMYRSLLMGIITPVRMKKNEDFMWKLADKQIDTFINRKSFEAMADFAKPFTIQVVADLLGIPEEDHEEFRKKFDPVPTPVGGPVQIKRNPLDFLDASFTAYIEDRRKQPRKDALTELAMAKFPDGSTPTVADVVNTATFLFGAGQDTSARLISFALQILGDRPDLQQQLRKDRALIPDFLEEVLRLEPPVKNVFRIAKVRMKVGDLEVEPGTTIMILIAALNRDPNKFDRRNEFMLGRKNVREHLSFSRGIHACAGAPLARAEGMISMNRFFDRLSEFHISDAKHGPTGARRFSYEPTYLLRGLQALHMEFTPQTGARAA